MTASTLLQSHLGPDLRPDNRPSPDAFHGNMAVQLVQAHAHSAPTDACPSPPKGSWRHRCHMPTPRAAIHRRHRHDAHEPTVGFRPLLVGHCALDVLDIGGHGQ